MIHPPPFERLASRGMLVAALLIFFFLALDTAGRKAITTDEPLHLTHSITMAQTGAMRIPEMHAPLTYRLVGSLLLVDEPLPDVTTLASWPSQNPFFIGRELIRRADLALDRVVWLGRFVVVCMGLLLGALMIAWTRSLARGFLPVVAVVALLFAFSPNFLASAALVTTDIAVTMAFLACVYAWWRFWERPAWGRWLLVGICLGLALAAKLTGVLLLPILLTLAYARRRPGQSWLWPGLIWLSLLPVAGLLLWATYGFETRVGLPMPAYWEAWQLLLHEVDASTINFFFGRVMPSGSWLYFPAALLLKTPLLQLALFLLIPLVLWRERHNWRDLLFVALPPAVFIAVAVISRVNYGYRHTLPALPFLIILGSLSVPFLWRRPVTRVILIAAMGWTALSAVRTHPDHLAYFNELSRGQGYRYLGDSNLDWGQDLNQLGRYARDYTAATGRPLYYSYAGIADPAHYGLEGTSIIRQFQAGQMTFAPANPAAGRYAINVSDLQGPGLNLGILTEIDLFDWFRHRQPLDTLGGSIFIYDVGQQAEGNWIAHCLSPGPLLTDEQAEQLVGRSDLRHVRFDCTSSWVFPDNGTAGWYVLPAVGEQWIERLLGDHSPEVVYQHRANEYGPDYVIAYWPGSSGDPTRGDNLHPFAGDNHGPASLRAYDAANNEWITVWQVREATAAPLSVQAHLLSADGTVGVADGLGFPADQWRPGDWFAQRHIFDKPGDTLTTGLYDYVTLEPVTEPAQLSPP